MKCFLILVIALGLSFNGLSQSQSIAFQDSILICRYYIPKANHNLIGFTIAVILRRGVTIKEIEKFINSHVKIIKKATFYSKRNRPSKPGDYLFDDNILYKKEQKLIRKFNFHYMLLSKRPDDFKSLETISLKTFNVYCGTFYLLKGSFHFEP